jgi:hypothetical protein
MRLINVDFIILVSVELKQLRARRFANRENTRYVSISDLFAQKVGEAFDIKGSLSAREHRRSQPHDANLQDAK